MKKVIISRRMYDMASERSITALSRTMESKTEHTGNAEKMTDSSSKHEDPSKFPQEISLCNLSVQSGDEKMSEQASTSKLTEQNVASSLLEQASASKSPERIRSKPAGTLCIYQLVERPITRQLSTEKETNDGLSESRPHEEWVRKLKNLHQDYPKLKLLKQIDVGNLFAICYQHPEFRPLVTSILQVHEFVSSSWNIHEQDVLIRICKDIEAILTEIVSMKSKPHSSHVIKDKFARLSWCINEFIDILHLHMDTLHTEKLRFSPFLSASEGRKWFKRTRKASVREYLINELIEPKTYMSTTIDTEYLIRILQEHTELLPSVECVLDVYSAMKFLDYEGQIKIYKLLSKVQKFLRQIIQQKDWGDNSSLIKETADVLIDCINLSFTETMANLSSQCQKLKKKTFECGPCQSVLRLVRDVNLKPQQQRLRIKENPHRHLKGVVAFANYGISGDYLKNLETLFHHLAAKRGAYRHVQLYRTAVDWSKITDQHKQYKDKFSENCEQMEIIRSHIIRRLDECKEVMAEAREFAERFRKTSFPNPRNLSVNFGLNAQLEPFAFDAEDFLTTLDRLISHFLDDLKTYRSLNVSVRRERCSFLINPQTFAFDFPLC